VKSEGWPVAEYTYDFRVGGQERGHFSPDGKMTIINETTYWDIVPDQRLIMAYAMDIDSNRISVSVATIEFKPEGKKHPPDLYRARRVPRRLRLPGPARSRAAASCTSGWRKRSNVKTRPPSRARRRGHAQAHVPAIEPTESPCP
jgi:uncharacterized protein YndB with AHSA1/START domain